MKEVVGMESEINFYLKSPAGDNKQLLGACLQTEVGCQKLKCRCMTFGVDVQLPDVKAPVKTVQLR